MTEINTTSINDLPTDPSSGGTVGGNVNLTISEIAQSQQSGNNDMSHSNQTQGLSLDQNTISQIVNGLQQASLTGATMLPSRDIPINSEQLTRDSQIQPNYVPPPNVRDYIRETDDDINNYYRKEKMDNSLDSIYDEIQTPLLLGVLYFLFQLPIFKKLIFKYASFLCHNDGNYNFNGLIFICILFGFIYYMLSKTVKNFSRF